MLNTLPLTESKRLTDKEREEIRSRIVSEAERIHSIYKAEARPRYAAIFKHAADQAAAWNFTPFKQLSHVKPHIGIPVTIDEFVQNPDFIGDLVKIWPENMKELIKMAPDVFIGEPALNTICFEGGTGTGKTELAKTLTNFYMYNLLCFNRIPEMWGLGPTRQLFVPLQSRSLSQSTRDIYKPIRLTLTKSPFFKRFFPWKRDLESKLDFHDDQISIGPLLADPQQTIGTDIPFGIIDEANFHRVVENSSVITGQGGGVGGRFDQAESTYREVDQRITSRFVTQGYKVGALIIISSVAYDEDFTDRTIKQARQLGHIRTPENPRGTFYVYAKRRYEVAPAGKYSKQTFRLLIGTEKYPTTILNLGEQAPKDGHVVDVPVDLIESFQKDPERSVRDVLGIRRYALSPFIERADKITEATRRGMSSGLKPWAGTEVAQIGPDGRAVIVGGVIQTDVSMDVVLGRSDLSPEGTPWVFPSELPSDRHTPRYLHVDLSSTGDRCGIAMVKIRGKSMQDIGEGLLRSVPHFAVELAMSIKPSKAYPIDAMAIVDWIVRLATDHKFNVACVSYDGFDKGVSRLELSKSGFTTRYISMDRTTDAYDHLRKCLYEDRVDLVHSEILQTELSRLELDKVKMKVDHPVRGTKDISDAVAGALWSAHTARDQRGTSVVTDSEGKQVNAQAVSTGRTRRSSGRRPFGR